MESIEDQFMATYDQTADAIFRYCHYRVYDREKAKDLTQEVFKRFWQMLREGQTIHNQRAMLYRVARNLVIDYARRIKEQSLDAMLEGGFDASSPVDEELAIQQQIDNKKMLQLLQALRPEARECVELRYLGELKVHEIAKILSISQTAVSVRLYRALAQLKKMLYEQ